MGRKPKLREPRQRRRLLGIDKLPQEVRDEIARLREQECRSWKEIEELAPTVIQRLAPQFAGFKASDNAWQRWYVLRIEGDLAEGRARAELRDRVRREWTGRHFKDMPKAVLGKLGDVVVDISLARNPAALQKALLEAGWLLARNRQLDQEAERLALEERKLERMERAGKKLAAEVETAAKKGKDVDLKQLAAKVREIYEG